MVLTDKHMIIKAFSKIRVFDNNSYEFLQELEGEADIYSLATSFDENYLAAGQTNGYLSLFKLNGEQYDLIKHLKTPEESNLLMVTFHPSQSNLVVLGFQSGEIKILQFQEKEDNDGFQFNISEVYKVKIESIK